MLRAALDLITEAGIDRLRLEAIARRAGMSSGQVMYYFATKEQILLETLAWQEDRDGRNRRAVLPAAGGAWRQLERYVDLYFPSGPADPAWILWTEAWARAPHDPQVSDFLDELSRPWGADLADIILRGQRAGTFAGSVRPEDFTICFSAMLDGLAILHLHQRPDMPREHLIELAMNTARTMLNPDGQAGTYGTPR